MNHLIEDKIRDIAVGVCEENNLELVHAQIVGSGKSLTIRIFIDREGGVTHEDCSKVSRQFEATVDADDFIPSAYLLEVSSPGLERELYSLQDFNKFVGKLAKIKTNTPIDGQKNFRGIIAAVEDQKIVFEDTTKGAVNFPYSVVAKASLEIDLEEELKRNG